MNGHPPKTAHSATGLASTPSHWTQKQKARRIVLQPQSRLNPTSVASNNPKATANSSLFKSQECALIAQAPKQHSSAASEKQSHYSKSQQAVKRQRSALWIAKANLLNINLNSQARKTSQNLSGAASKEISTTQGFFSPKGAKVQLRTQQSLGQQAHIQLGSSPGAFIANKQKKHSAPVVRLTVEKYLKKRVGEQLAIFAKAGVPIPNSSHIVIPSSKMGEVFSSLAKSSHSRAGAHQEIANMLRASTTNQVQSKGAQKKKKHSAQQPNTKQILTSMGLNATPIMAATPVKLASLHPTAKNHHNLPLHSALNFSSMARYQTGKTTQKGAKRTSQSRLETFELANQPVAYFNNQKKTYNLPVHKIKKRFKQNLVNHSLQSLQESLFNHQSSNNRESRLTGRQGRTHKHTQNRSKSKSPVKKSSSRVGHNNQNKARPITKYTTNRVKKAGVSRFVTGVESQQVSTYDVHRTDGLSSMKSLDASIRAAHLESRGEDAGTRYQVSNLNRDQITAGNGSSSNQLLQVQTSAQKGRRDNHLNEIEQISAMSSGHKEGKAMSSDDQSVADEVFDSVAAEAVLRELSKLCALQIQQPSDEDDDQEVISRASHRSHDNIGYVASPLIERASLQGDSVEDVGRRAFSEQELQEQLVIMSGDDSECDDFLDVSEEGTVPQGHPAHQRGQEIDKDDLMMADCVSDAISVDERITTEVHHTQKKLTVPTMQAHALQAHHMSKNSQEATHSSGQNQPETHLKHVTSGSQQTATYKEEQQAAPLDVVEPFNHRIQHHQQHSLRTGPPLFEAYQDIHEWQVDLSQRGEKIDHEQPNHDLVQDQSLYSGGQEQAAVEHACTSQQIDTTARQIHMRASLNFPGLVVSGVLSKPKSPSNVSQGLNEDDDDDSGEGSATADDIEGLLAVADEHQSTSVQGLD